MEQEVERGATAAFQIAYPFALSRFHDSPVTVIKTLGCCNLVLLAICAWYTWREEKG